MIDLCIDARMALSSGIGTCIRQLAPFFNHPPFRAILLVDRLGHKWCENFEQIVFPAPIYSIQEQVSFPFKIPCCDLFWSPHYNVPLIPIRAKKRIATIHDACHLAFSHTLSLPERIYAKFVMRRALHGSDAVVTDSSFSKGELIRFLGAPKKGLQVIFPGVDQERYQKRSDPHSCECVRKKYQLPEKYLLFVGNVKPHKNLSGLVRAFHEFSSTDQSDPCALVIVGKRMGLRNSEKNFTGHGIFPIGEVLEEELPVLYSLAEGLVFPSFYEGFGLPPLEAMSCRCPTIVSQAASMPEICKEASLYIDPENPASIREAIQKLRGDAKLKEDLIQKGLVRVKEFDWAKSAAGYRRLFEEVQGA